MFLPGRFPSFEYLLLTDSTLHNVMQANKKL
jgi:hypothetical protein